METSPHQIAEDKKLRSQHTPANVQQLHIKKWKKSSLSMSEYCRRQGLSVSRLSSWVKKRTKPQALFKPIVAAPINKEPPIRSNMIEVLFGQQIKIRFFNTTDLSMILTMIKEIGPCS